MEKFVVGAATFFGTMALSIIMAVMLYVGMAFIAPVRSTKIGDSNFVMVSNDQGISMLSPRTSAAP